MGSIRAHCSEDKQIGITMKPTMIITKGTQISQKHRSHLKIQGARRVTQSSFHTEDLQILVAAIHNLVAHWAWHTRFCEPLTHSMTELNSTHEVALYSPSYIIMQVISVFKDKNVYQDTESTPCKVG
jgi:hypothetical protein